MVQHCRYFNCTGICGSECWAGFASGCLDNESDIDFDNDSGYDHDSDNDDDDFSGIPR